MNEYKVLCKPFNINTHKNVFIDYLEVIIKPNGVIEYAVPSHQKKLENIAIKQYGEVKFNKMVNELSFTADYLQFLLDITGCVSVWNDFCQKPKCITSEQINSLELLKNTNYDKIPLSLYRGEI